MGGLASAPGIRNIGDPINLSTPGGVLFVGAAGDFQENTAQLFWSIGNKTLLVNDIIIGHGFISPTDPSSIAYGTKAFGGTGVIPVSGWNTTAIGGGALQTGSNVTNCTAIGYGALNQNNNSVANTVIGSQAALNLGATGIESDNTVIGYQALGNNVSGSKNTAIGSGALKGAVGNTSTDNVAIGYHAMFNSVNSQSNVCIGRQAGDGLTTSTNNVIIGQSAGQLATTAGNNTIIGYGAHTTGNFAQCVIVGYSGQVSGNNAIAIGTTVAVAANTTEIGNAATVSTILHGIVTMAGGITTGNAASLVTTSVAMNNGAAAAAGTLNNAPAAGNPTKWVPFNDNGTVRYIPTW